MGYLLSIVIPTKDRYFYLKNLIQLIDGFKSNEIELVIQDNSSNNEDFVKFLKEQDNKNVKYFYCPDKLSMSQNSDIAILNSTGEYVCFIGDDDGVFDNIVEIVRMMKEKGIEAILPSRSIYNWPDFFDGSYYKLTSTLLLNKGKKKLVPVNVQKELGKAIKSGFKNLGRMPRVYQAIVIRKKLDDIYSRYGSFFPGGSPDMANAVALSLEGCNCYYFDYPVVITGQSKSVGGGERTMIGLKSIDEIPFLPTEQKDYWHKSLPKLWCSDTIWPMSAYCVLIKSGREDLVNQINWNIAKARFLFNHWEYKDQVVYNSIIYYYFILFFIEKVYYYILNRIVYIISRGSRLSSGYLFRNVLNIQMCINCWKREGSRV